MAKALILKEENPYILEYALGKPLIFFVVKEVKKVFDEILVSGLDVQFAERRDIDGPQDLFEEMEDGEELFFAKPSFIGIFAEDIIEARERNDSFLFFINDELAGGLLKKGQSIEDVRNKLVIDGVKVEDRFSFIDALHLLRYRKLEEVITAGVMVMDPFSTWIDEDVEVASGVVIEHNVTIKGWVRIEEGARIRSYTYIENIGKDGKKPETPMVIKRNASIGPFSRLRLDAIIGEGAAIGNFVEVKKSYIGKNVKAQHLTYLGDAEIGEDSNIGAGTITCNYDGVKKNKTRIGARVFVGSGVELVAPVEIEDDVYIAAGSTITDRVPRFSLAIARARQVNKEGWVLKKRKEWEEKLKKS